ncbi:MAG: hypothetical protein ACRC8S_02825 [Fimbriiglobus sp.]
MADDSLEAALRPLIARIQAYLVSQPELLAEAQVAAEAFAVWAKTARSTPAPSAPTAPTQPTPPTSAPELREETISVVQVLPPVPRQDVVSIPANFDIPILPKFDSIPVLKATAEKAYTPATSSLAEIAARCRLKAQVSRAFADAAELDSGIAEHDRTVWLRQAQEMRDCYLWMLYLKPLPPGLWNNLASAYDCAAEAADLLGKLEPDTDPEQLKTLLQLMAEGQAVLYAAVEGMDFGTKDYDQIGLFKWIQDRREAEDIFIPRFLKSSDRADPATAPDVLKRLREARTVSRPKDSKKEVKKALGNLKYKLKPLQTDPLGETVDWPGVVAMVDRLILELRVPANHIELRECLIPAQQVIPEEHITPPLQAALEEVDRYLEVVAKRELEEESRDHEPVYNSEVLKVREHLHGTELVFIGGDARPHSADSVIAAFGLSDLNWIAVPRHSSTSIFESPIARQEVRVVVVATRWSSHSYQDVRDFCVKYGKLFIKLPAGYHPNQLAHAILTQAGQRLAT